MDGLRIALHFRSYNHIAFMVQEYFLHYNAPVQLQFFAEKHGKGMVDSLFATVQSWLTAFLQHGEDNKITSFDELVRVCTSGAKKATAQDPGRTSYHVVRYNSEKKPASRWVLDATDWQIQSTYCLRIEPYAGNFQRPIVRNMVFSDAHKEASSFVPCISTEPIQDRSWRKGYFSNKNWQKEKPKHGEKTTLMSKQDLHQSMGLTRPRLTTAWEDATARHVRKLELRRAKWQRRLKASLEEEDAQASSSGSSSGSSSSESSSDSDSG